MGSRAGNSSSVKGAREQSVLGQASDRANKTSTAATDFLPLSCHSVIYCRAAKKQLLQLLIQVSPLIQIESNACSHPKRYLDQKVPPMQRQIQAAEYICYQKRFPWDITRKREVVFWRKLFKKRLAWGYRVLRLKEVTFLFLQLADTHEARSAMMCKPPTYPYWFYKHCQ